MRKVHPHNPFKKSVGGKVSHLSVAKQIPEMEGNRTETIPQIVKDDAVKADVSIKVDETASPNLCKTDPLGKVA